MKQSVRVCVAVFQFCLFSSLLLTAQQSKPGVVGADELKKVVPAACFFRGQPAPVQLRNSVGFRGADGKLVLAGLVDTSGYAADLAAKYQGFLITEVKLDVGGAALAPGQYGFGFNKDGKFVVMDVGAHELLSVATQADDKVAHPVPLKMVEEGGAYKLYAGKKWVSLKAE
jgi:hypothetical protein